MFSRVIFRFSHVGRNAGKLVKHWDDLIAFTKLNQDSPYMRELLQFLEGSSGETIYRNLLAMSVCWHLVLDGLWKQLAKANVPESVKALDDFATLCACASSMPDDWCIEWLLDRNVNTLAPIDDSNQELHATDKSKC